MKITLAEICAAIGATCELGEAEKLIPNRVITDSRNVAAGDLFFCIPGERFDGHDFAAEALAKGAVAVVAERWPSNVERNGVSSVMLTPNTVAALGDLARMHRLASHAAVVGVTGSAGKTTVKELLAQILSVRGETAKNFMNLNNQIGLPSSMLEASGQERFWVMEAGISELHDMDELGDVLLPDLAVVVNVGQAHLSGLGDTESVAKCKTKIFNYLRPDGAALISLDYSSLVVETTKVFPDAEGYSVRNPSAKYYARYLGPANGEHGRFHLRLNENEFEITFPGRGDSVAENLVAAAAAAAMLGLSPDEIQTGLNNAQPPKQRFEIFNVGESMVIDDSYNANPLSLAASLQNAKAYAEDRPLVLALGEMLELGDQAGEAHKQAGLHAAHMAPAAVFWRGAFAEQFTNGLAEGGYHDSPVIVDGVESFISAWRALDLAEGPCVVLFKGSRGTRMDELAGALLQELKHDL